MRRRSPTRSWTSLPRAIRDGLRPTTATGASASTGAPDSTTSRSLRAQESQTFVGSRPCNVGTKIAPCTAFEWYIAKFTDVTG